MMWQPFADGKSVGSRGSEDGTILLDEEHTIGARITLERDAVNAPFAITCGIYGLMFHTRFFASETEARAELDRMKGTINDMFTEWEQRGDQLQQQDMAEAASAFVDMFP